MSEANTPSAGVHKEYQRLSAIGPPGHPKVGSVIRLDGEDVNRIVRGREKRSTPGLFGVAYTEHVLDDDRRVVLKGKGRVRAERGRPFINASDWRVEGLGGIRGARPHLVKHDAARKRLADNELADKLADDEIHLAMERGSMMADMKLRAEALGLTGKGFRAAFASVVYSIWSTENDTANFSS